MNLAIFLKKFHYFVTPVGLIALIILIGLVLSLFRFRKTSKLMLSLALICFWLFSSPWFAQSLAVYSASLHPPAPAFNSLQKGDADAIVVATWLMPMRPDSDTVMRYANPKAYQAALLSKKLDIPIIVISSQYPPNPLPGPGEVTYARAYLSKLNIPDNHIIITRNAINTHEALKTAVSAIDAIKAKNIILIASGSRLTRKYTTLEKLTTNNNIKIIPFTGYTGTPNNKDIRFDSLRQWLPTIEALQRTHGILHDLIGMWVYRIIGWL